MQPDAGLEISSGRAGEGANRFLNSPQGRASRWLCDRGFQIRLPSAVYALRLADSYMAFKLTVALPYWL